MLRTMNACLIEHENDFGEVVVKATRADTDSTWFIGAMVDGKMINLGELYAHGPEVLKRKLILAMIDRLIMERSDCERDHRND